MLHVAWRLVVAIVVVAVILAGLGIFAAIAAVVVFGKLLTGTLGD